MFPPKPGTLPVQGYNDSRASCTEAWGSVELDMMGNSPIKQVTGTR